MDVRDPASKVRKSRIFISYSRKDLTFATQLAEALKLRGFDILLDRTDIAAGEDWQQRLSNLILEADTVVFSASPASAQSTVCTWEVYEAKRLGKRILPIVAKTVAPEHLQTEIAKLNLIFFSDRDFDVALRELEQALLTDLDWLRQHTKIGEQASQWQQSNSSRARLLRGSALNEAEHWLAKTPENAGVATDLHRDFIRASRTAAIRRQRFWMVGAAAVTASSIALTIWGEVNRRDAVTQKQTAELQRAEAIKQKDRAEKTVNTAAATANDLVFELAQQFRLVQGVPTSVIRKIVEKSQGLQEQLTSAGEQSPELKRGLAMSMTELSTTLLAQGDNEGALISAEKSVKIAEELVASYPELPQRREDLSVSLFTFGNALEAENRVPDALEKYFASNMIYDQLLVIDPQKMIWQKYQAVTLQKIADIQMSLRNVTEAVTNYSKSLEISKRLATRYTDDLKLQNLLALAYGRMRNIEFQRHDYASALMNDEASIKIAQQLILAEPGNTDHQRNLALSQISMGDTLVAQHKIDDALKIDQEALTNLEKLAATDRENGQWQNDVILGHSTLGDIYLEQRDWPKAEEKFQRAVNLSEQLASSHSNNFKWQHNVWLNSEKLARLQLQLGKLAGADTNFNEARAALEEMLKKDPSNKKLLRDLGRVVN